MANIGEQLTQPEDGYQRISLASSPNKEKCITTNLKAYSGKDYAYNGFVFYDIVKANPSSITFYINSKKFRFISKVDYEANAKNSVKVIFDDNKYVFVDQYQNGSTVKGLILQADKIFNTSLHKITISSENNGYMWVDCIDIDTNGALLTEEEYIKMSIHYLIQDNSTEKIYNYDEENNQLVEVSDSSILINEDTVSDCIYDLNKVLPLLDTLSDDLTLLCNKDKKVIAKGLKRDNFPLVIARTSFSTRLAENIDFFELLSNISDTSSVKMAVSVDTGTTWKVWDNESDSFVDLNNRPPLKKYEELSEEQLTQWNTFRDEVNEKGIDSKILKNINFNSIKSDDMMFAYVFNRNSYEDKCMMSKLQYQFDAYGSYTLLNSDSNISIKQSTDAIVVTPKKDMDLMKVNIGSSGQVTINNSTGGKSIDITEEEYQQMMEEIRGE